MLWHHDSTDGDRKRESNQDDCNSRPICSLRGKAVEERGRIAPGNLQFLSASFVRRCRRRKSVAQTLAWQAILRRSRPLVAATLPADENPDRPVHSRQSYRGSPGNTPFSFLVCVGKRHHLTVQLYPTHCRSRFRTAARVTTVGRKQISRYNRPRKESCPAAWNERVI